MATIGTMLTECPKCGAAPFVPFQRGLVCRNLAVFGLGLFFKRFRQTALICWTCKDIVGWEDDEGLP